MDSKCPLLFFNNSKCRCVIENYVQNSKTALVMKTHNKGAQEESEYNYSMTLTFFLKIGRHYISQCLHYFM